MKDRVIKYAIVLFCTVFGLSESFAESESSGFYSVGSIQGNAEVSATGAATYNFNFTIPDADGFTPQVGIGYSSQQAAYGAVGYGFDITGISVITSGGKDIFHDRENTGANYDESSTFYLDGKRLVLVSGSIADGNAVYNVEGSPHTTVTAVGRFIHTFIVHATDGTEYEYGTTGTSKISWRDANNNPLCAAWYITKAKDKYGNVITYNYSAYNNRIYPSSIYYGATYSTNGTILRSSNCSIQFFYENLDTTNPSYYIGSHKITTSKILKRVKCYKGDELFREYCFSYTETNESSGTQYTKLSSITEKNKAGECFPPQYFSWHGLDTPSMSRMDVSTSFDTSWQYENKSDNLNKKEFFSYDVNNDGLSDLIRIDEKIVSNTSRRKISVNLARKDTNGGISFAPAESCTFERSENRYSTSSLGQPIDIDGDGINEIFAHSYCSGNTISSVFYRFYKYDQTIVETASDFLSLSHKGIPLITSMDWDGDGIDNLLVLETGSNDSNYCLHIIGKPISHYYCTSTSILLNVGEEPKKIFAGDYDNDGRLDLMVVTDNGYKIFSYNSSTNLNGSLMATYSSSTIKDVTFIKDGDFNGDGLTDFIFFSNKNNIDKFQIAFSRGNGGFTLSGITDIPHEISKDNKTPTLRSVLVLDINGDGKSDVVTIQTGWELFPILPNVPSYVKRTITSSFISNGSELQLYSSRDDVLKDESLLNDRYIFVSDFDGNGVAELANYGTRLDEDDNTEYTNCIHIYRNTSALNADVNKLVRVINGFGVSTVFDYGFLTDTNLYEKGSGDFPLNSISLPLSVAKSKRIYVDNNTLADERYSYKDLKVHRQGKGVLGFSEVAVEDNIRQSLTKNTVATWNTLFYVPASTRTTVELGGKTSTTESVFQITPFNNGKNYYSYMSENTVTDFDGNTSLTTNLYNTEKGVPVRQRIQTGENMYKQVDYANYTQKSGVWLPQTVTSTQKHEDDSSIHQNVCLFYYDDKGNVVQKTERAGSSMPLTTMCSYGFFGNILSQIKVKAGKVITERFEYDDMGRHAIRAYQIPDCGQTLYRYDSFGNVIEKRDSISPDHVLVSEYEYDDWGRQVFELKPDGSSVQHLISRDVDGGYKMTKIATNAPVVIVSYDALGRKVSEATKGEKNVDILTSYHYNAKGQVSSVTHSEGNLATTVSYEYDSWGRKTREEASSGAYTTYSYGNRSVTESNGTTTVTNVHDAWGNIVQSTDNLATVEYIYSSNGQPVCISTNGHSVSIGYDDAGNRTTLSDPDAGTMTYSYTMDGAVLTQTDGRGISTNFVYDNHGRVVQKERSGETCFYDYGTSGYGKYLLKSKSLAGDSIKYEYDRYGHIIRELRKVGTRSFEKSYEYGADDLLLRVGLPGGLAVEYSYDDNGFVDSAYANDSLIYNLSDYNGTLNKRTGACGLTLSDTYDTDGFIQRKKINIADRSAMLTVDFTFNKLTGNLSSKKISPSLERPSSGGIEPIGPATPISSGQAAINGYLLDNSMSNKYDILRTIYETYEYDALDRLTAVTRNERPFMSVSYDNCGNITFKTGVGDYSYDKEHQPHAVIGVENTNGSAGTQNVLYSYHPCGKLESISSDDYDLVNTFGIDDEKWQSVLSRNDSIIRNTVYFDNIEEITENGVTYTQYFLDNDVIVIKRNGSFEYYQAFTDQQGNILDVYDRNGQAVFEARYDAWGKQTVTKNTIGLRHGYTGHEMLPEFGLIDMKGRVYDPAIGRFLSPDNYVQEPTNSQSFNRYSYCVNNPLKYVDPSGELFGIDDIVFAFAAIQMAGSMIKAAIKGENVWKAAGISLLSSAATYGIGSIFGCGGGIGRELLRAGTHGLSSGAATALSGGNFFNGFASGALSSGIGSFAQGVELPSCIMISYTTAMGGVASMATGGGFWQGAMNGLAIGFLNHHMHEGDLGSPYKYGIQDGMEDSQYLNYLRHRIATDPDFKQEIIAKIEADGKLDFQEAKLWYQIGDGTEISVQASKLELRNLDISQYQMNNGSSYNCFQMGNNLNEALVYGKISVTKVGINTFRIGTDIYDFNIEWNKAFSLRNFATVCSRIIHGYVTPYKINFKGLWIKK